MKKKLYEKWTEIPKIKVSNDSICRIIRLCINCIRGCAVHIIVIPSINQYMVIPKFQNQVDLLFYVFFLMSFILSWRVREFPIGIHFVYYQYLEIRFNGCNLIREDLFELFNWYSVVMLRRETMHFQKLVNIRYCTRWRGIYRLSLFLSLIAFHSQFLPKCQNYFIT